MVHRVDQGPAEGMQFLIRLPEDKGIWTGTYENFFANKFANDVKPYMVAYDIGGWHGFFAGVMAAQGAREVHVFEPLPENQQRIAKLVELNPEHDITLHSLAVGDVDGDTELIVMPQTSMAKLASSPFQPGSSNGARVSVPLVRLDTIVREGAVPAPDIIKIDVEGAEEGVLRGAEYTLATHHPLIFAEIHSSDLLASCSKILTRHGYVIEALDEDATVAAKRDVFQIVARPVSST